MTTKPTISTISTKRTPFRVTIRRVVTGADYTATLWLHGPAEAFPAMLRRVPRGERMTSLFRLVACEPWRPSGHLFSEIEARHLVRQQGPADCDWSARKARDGKWMVWSAAADHYVEF